LDLALIHPKIRKPERVVRKDNCVGCCGTLLDTIAWAKAIRTITTKGRTEFAPLIVAITGFTADGKPEEIPEIREQLDQLLEAKGKQTVETVAGTIFPYHMWKPKADRSQLFIAEKFNDAADPVAG
jgi:hypothetical protein